jgi:hypothetical protein
MGSTRRGHGVEGLRGGGDDLPAMGQCIAGGGRPITRSLGTPHPVVVQAATRGRTGDARPAVSAHQAATQASPHWTALPLLALALAGARPPPYFRSLARLKPFSQVERFE